MGARLELLLAAAWLLALDTSCDPVRSRPRHQGRVEQFVEPERPPPLRSCSGLANSERDEPLFARERVVGVDSLPLSIAPAYRGAVVIFRRVPGLTVERLQRVVSCRLARDAELGPGAREPALDPLAPAEVNARVLDTPSGIGVAIWSMNLESARQVRQRIGAVIGRKM